MKIIKPVNVVVNSGVFNRAGTATYFDSDGLMKTAAADIPRFQFDPATNGFEGLLIETGTTNLLTNSQNISAWTLSNATVTADSGTAPDGTVTADKLVENTGSGTHYCSQTVTLAASAWYTYSCFIKASGRGWVRLQTLNRAGTYYYAYFDITNGVLGTASGIVNTEIKNVGSGWYRCSISFPSGSGAIAPIVYTHLSTTNGGTTSYTGDGTSGVLIWGPQLAPANSPLATSYIPTASATVTRAADVNTSMMVSSVPESDYSAYSAAATYTTGDKVLYGGKIYESLQDGNTGNSPNTATLWWLDSGYDNRWRMFDKVVGSQTAQANSINLALIPGVIDSIAMLDVDATSVTVVMVNDGVVVYSSTVNLTSATPAVTDAYSYFFTPFGETQAVVFQGLPSYLNAVVSINISNPSSTARVGTLVVGAAKYIGGTQQDATISITDYSKKTTDDFGNVTITPRAFTKRLSCNLFLDNDIIDTVQNSLAAYRSTPVVWIGTDDGYSSMVIYGFYKSFSINIPGPDHALCSLDVEGMV